MQSNCNFAYTSGKTCLLIIGQQSIFRTGLVTVLQTTAGIEIHGPVPNTQEAIETYQRLAPDVVILDDLMPDISAPEFVSILLNIKRSNIIIVSSFETSEDVHKSLAAGAKSYLLKNIHPDELLKAVKEVQKGKTHILPSIASKLAERLSCQALSSRELQIAELIATGNTNRQIAKTLYLSEGTVKVHLTSIFSKLRVSNRNQAILKMFRHGIIHFNGNKSITVC